MLRFDATATSWEELEKELERRDEFFPNRRSRMAIQNHRHGYFPDYRQWSPLLELTPAS